MKRNIKIILLALVIGSMSCKKKQQDEPAPQSYIKATIGGKDFNFTQLAIIGWESDGSKQWQVMKASSSKGERPLRQMYCKIRPRDGVIKLDKKGEYDIVRIYYSEDTIDYSAWEGTKYSKAVFDLDTVKKTSLAAVLYKSGKFSGVVYNKTRDSLVITNGEFKFY